MGTERNIAPPAPCCVILGSGDILDYKAVAHRIPAGSFILCADGGLAHCGPLGLSPDLLVGDLDSVQNPPEGIAKVTCDAVDKDHTDTALAVEEAVSRGFRQLLLCGMLGGRLDHSLANLQILGWCAARGLDAFMTDGVTDIYPLATGAAASAHLVLEPRDRCYFSLLSLVDACEGVTITGGKYPLTEYPLSSLESPRAISNEFVGAPVRVTLRAGSLLVIVTPIR